FQFAIAGEEGKARADYAANWKLYRDCLRGEEDNITLPGEGEAVDELRDLTERYLELGERFYASPPGDPRRKDAYFRGGLEALPPLGAAGMGLLACPGGQGPLLFASALPAGGAGLEATFKEIKRVSGKILTMNQENMKAE